MMPIIRIEMESMKQSILHAFSERQLNLSNEVQLALDRALTSESIQEHLDRVAKEAVQNEISNAIRKWWSTSESAREMIQAAVSKRLEEEAQWYKNL